MATSNERRYRKAFFEKYGEGPYECVFCLNDVDNTEVIVHHFDHDHYNDAPENLVPAHRSCHIKHHKQEVSEETRHKISVAIKGIVRSPETRKKISESKIRRGPTGPDSLEVRQRKSEAIRKQWLDDPDRKTRIKRGVDGKFMRD